TSDRANKGTAGPADKCWPISQLTPEPAGDAMHQHGEEYPCEESHYEGPNHVPPRLIWGWLSAKSVPDDWVQALRTKWPSGDDLWAAHVERVRASWPPFGRCETSAAGGRPAGRSALHFPVGTG